MRMTQSLHPNVAAMMHKIKSEGKATPQEVCASGVRRSRDALFIFRRADRRTEVAMRPLRRNPVSDQVERSIASFEQQIGKANGLTLKKNIVSVGH